MSHPARGLLGSSGPAGRRCPVSTSGNLCAHTRLARGDAAKGARRGGDRPAAHRPAGHVSCCDTRLSQMKTIFVLDDDQDQAELLAEALSGETCRVRAFSDPIRALAALNADGTDLLIADLSMPWIDGAEVVASARVKRPQLKVILISGYEQAAEIAKRHGLTFFAKPLDLPRLREAALKAIG